MTTPHLDRPRLAPDWPALSVVMPVYREERFLRQAVTRVLQQDYPGEVELMLAVAPRDRCFALAQSLRREDERVRVVVNPSGTTPAGLNAALVASRHPVIVRVDAHSAIPDGYLRRVVELLETTGADNVGGVMDARGTTPFELAVRGEAARALAVADARRTLRRRDTSAASRTAPRAGVGSAVHRHREGMRASASLGA